MKGVLVGIAALVVGAAAVMLIVSKGTALPDQPVPIAWDREPCAHCHMQIGEPRHAVQLITSDGSVFDFDDVGCAVAFLRARQPHIHRLWFHGDGDSWLGTDVVGFVDADMTPMGSGLRAVDRRSADARTLDELLRSPPPMGAASSEPGGPR
ncbi:MAG: hypothetical protein U1F43_09400 [Myxococcota bacterium]